MAATHSFFSTSDIATKLLPALCVMTVDKEKTVRDQTFQTIELFLKKLQRISEDPQAAEEQEKAEGERKCYSFDVVNGMYGML